MMISFKKILNFGIPYKGYAFLNIFFNILYAFFSAMAFVSLMPMLNVLFKTTEKQFEKPIFNGIFNLDDYIKNYLNFYITKQLEINIEITLIFVISIVLLLFFLKNLSNYLALYFITYLRNGILRDLRNTMYDKIITLPIAYFSEKKKGDIMSRMTTDVNEIQISFLSILELIIKAPLTIIFSIIAMFIFSFELTIIVIIFIPISGIIISIIGKQLKKQSSLVQEEQGSFLSLLDETLNGQKIIKTFNAGKYFKSSFQNATYRFYIFSNKLLHKVNLSSPISEFLGICAIGFLLWFGGKMVLIEGGLSGTAFIVYMGLAYNILTPAKDISKASYSIQKGNAAAERILEILNAKNNIKESSNSIELKNFNKSISFKNVSFSYDDNITLNKISFNIKKGETVALVGPSGGGKTTIANLLNRFYDIDSGKIKIDDISIKNIKKSSLYKLIGIVTQESILFNDTILNNLLLGNPNAEKKEIYKAVKSANADEFIEKLENKYSTIIGDSGNKLSGGQKQRLSIARAILKNPEILILDEATSSLDTVSENLVQGALNKLMIGRTSLVIAHRLSTIQKADKIMVIDNGEIIEFGSHKSLMTSSKIYKNLVNLQSFK
jgi:subfamily B ATP-binding cassette protein MsbA